jgi:hypothetical protein
MTTTGTHHVHPIPENAAEPNTPRPTRPAKTPITRRKTGQLLTHPRPSRTRPRLSSVLPKTPIRCHPICHDTTYGFPSIDSSEYTCGGIKALKPDWSTARHARRTWSRGTGMMGS